MHKKCIRKKYAIRGQRMFVKFPSTPYIEFENNMDIRTDKILSKEEVHIFLGNEIYVEEKIDGANLGISFNDRGECLLQNRGDYLYFPLSGQWSALNKWLNINENTIFENITNEYILFGEWCYATHSIKYDALPDWFVAFDIFDKKENKFFSVQRRNEMIEKMGLYKVPMLGKGKYSLDQLMEFIGDSQYGNGPSEGIYLRQDEGAYLKYRAKIVRKGFKQKIDQHWTKGKIQHNKIKC